MNYEELCPASPDNDYLRIFGSYVHPADNRIFFASGTFWAQQAFGTVFFVDPANDWNYLAAVTNLRKPTDMALATEGGDEVMYVLETNPVTSKWSLNRIKYDHAAALDGDATVAVKADRVVPWKTGESGQLELRGDLVIFAAGTSIYAYDRVAKTLSALVSGINGPLSFILEDGEMPGQIDVYFVHDAIIRKATVFPGDPQLPKQALNIAPAFMDPLPPLGQFAAADLGGGAGLLPSAGAAEIRLVRGLDEDALSLVTLTAQNAALPGDMRSLSMHGPTEVLVFHEHGYGRLELAIHDDALLMGIGFVPFSLIEQDVGPNQGRANTTTSPGYFFQVNNVAFGGTLHLILNHDLARANGAEFYRVWLNGSEISNSFKEYKYNSISSMFDLIDFAPVGLPSQNAVAYRLKDNSVLTSPWYDSRRGAQINSTLVANGLRTLKVQFYDEDGNILVGDIGTQERVLLIENSVTSVGLTDFGINGVSQAFVCGCLKYHDKQVDSLSFKFLAHFYKDPGATYSLSVYCPGGAAGESGPAWTSYEYKPKSVKLVEIMGNCKVALVNVGVGTSIAVINGYSYIGGQYAAVQFVLVPDTVDVDD